MSTLEKLYDYFGNLKGDERRTLDSTLAELEKAKLPGAAGEKARSALRAQAMTGGIDPNALALIGAYRAWKFKLQYQPITPEERKHLEAFGVPPAAIDEQLKTGRAQWEADQLTAYQSIVQLVTKPIQMAPEAITASPQAPTPAPSPRPSAPSPRPPAPVQATPAPAYVPPPPPQPQATPVPVAAPVQSVPPAPIAPVAPLMPTGGSLMSIGGVTIPRQGV